MARSQGSQRANTCESGACRWSQTCTAAVLSSRSDLLQVFAYIKARSTRFRYALIDKPVRNPHHDRDYLGLTNSILPLSTISPPSVVPDILSASTVNEHLANATVRPGLGCVVRVTRFPSTTPSSGCWFR